MSKASALRVAARGLARRGKNGYDFKSERAESVPPLRPQGDPPTIESSKFTAPAGMAVPAGASLFHPVEDESNEQVGEHVPDDGEQEVSHRQHLLHRGWICRPTDILSASPAPGNTLRPSPRFPLNTLILLYRFLKRLTIMS